MKTSPRKVSRVAAAAVPETAAFATMQQIRAYLGGETIRCLLCGRDFVSMSNHLGRAHGISAYEYKKRFGIPVQYGLVGSALRQEQSNNALTEWSKPGNDKRRRTLSARARDMQRHGPPSYSVTAPPPAFIESLRRPESWTRLFTKNHPVYLAAQKVDATCAQCGAVYQSNAMAVKTRGRPLLCPSCKTARAQERERIRGKKRIKFTSREDVEAYFADDLIKCLACGRRFPVINTAHLRKHGLDVASYRARYGLPASIGLVGARLRQEQSDRMSSRWQAMPTAEKLRRVEDIRSAVQKINRSTITPLPPYAKKEGASRMLASPRAAANLAHVMVNAECNRCMAVIKRSAAAVKTNRLKLLCDDCRRALDRERHRQKRRIATVEIIDK